MAETLGLAASLLGYVGAAVIILGYFLNQAGRLRSEDWRFPALNLLGSALILVSLAWQPNAPSVAVEAFWSAISLYGLGKNLRARRGA